MKPIHPLRHGAVNAADEAQDSAFPSPAQIPSQAAESDRNTDERKKFGGGENLQRSDAGPVHVAALANGRGLSALAGGGRSLSRGGRNCDCGADAADKGASDRPEDDRASHGSIVAQIPHQTAKLPHTPSFYPENETPAELIRAVATLLATLGEPLRSLPSEPRCLVFRLVDVIEMRAKLATVYDSLETSGQQFELTAQGRSALDRSVNDRGPLAKARHDSAQRDDAAWKSWIGKP